MGLKLLLAPLTEARHQQPARRLAAQLLLLRRNPLPAISHLALAGHSQTVMFLKSSFLSSQRANLLILLMGVRKPSHSSL